MNAIEQNKEKIKELIKQGKAVGNDIHQQRKIQDLRQMYLIIQANNFTTIHKETFIEDFERKLESVARELNRDFANNYVANVIKEDLEFQDVLKEKLTDETERKVYENLILHFNAGQVNDKLRENNFNIFTTFANMHGFANINEYIENKNKLNEDLEKQKQEQKQFDMMKKAFKEALMETSQSR